ncbi:MAG: metalloregulator ArsR/SmtB family transcription factor [Alphaproteobacteria bacterium]|nr:metalloregulator ArsR/SmtB family transcription factor [Rhodospirillales bacterium]MCW9045201.1 metalloregulator ArsR/SmtB family transcription factor [Alphaproteobacteria bacterium]
MLLANQTNSYALQAKMFRGLSDQSRLAILEALRGGALSVGQIVEATGLSQSNTSNHLRCLSDCGLISPKQDGRFVYYRLADQRIETLLRLADELLAETGRKVFECTNYSADQRRIDTKQEVIPTEEEE